jgi:hypothetical protein
MTAAVIVPAPSPAPAAKSTPVTVLTGFLGAGKTTLILSILKQLDPNYKVVVLKNEFGDVEGGWWAIYISAGSSLTYTSTSSS